MYFFSNNINNIIPLKYSLHPDTYCLHGQAVTPWNVTSFGDVTEASSCSECQWLAMRTFLWVHMYLKQKKTATCCKYGSVVTDNFPAAKSNATIYMYWCSDMDSGGNLLVKHVVPFKILTMTPPPLPSPQVTYKPFTQSTICSVIPMNSFRGHFEVKR